MNFTGRQEYQYPRSEVLGNMMRALETTVARQQHMQARHEMEDILLSNLHEERRGNGSSFRR